MAPVISRTEFPVLFLVNIAKGVSGVSLRMNCGHLAAPQLLHLEITVLTLKVSVGSSCQDKLPPLYFPHVL